MATLEFNVEYLKNVNYSLVHNHIPVCKSIVLENKSSEILRDVRVVARGEFIKETTTPIYTIVDGNSMLRIKELDLLLDASALSSLTEKVVTDFTLTVYHGEEEIHSQVFPLDIMAFDQWLGMSISPQCLASFVMPNLSAINEIIVKAGEIKKQETGSASFSGYQSNNPEEALRQVAALFKAIHKEGIIYRSCPPSYEEIGQRIVLPDQVIRGKIGNCLELTLLMASLLENISLNPILVLTHGHAYLGVWLVEDSYSHSVGDDASFLEKKCSKGINEIIMLECTEIAMESTSFEKAIKMGEQNLSDLDDFVMFLDIHRCRLERFLPLPVRTIVDGKWYVDVEGVEHENANIEIPHHTRYDLESLGNSQRQLTRLDIWERKLLDFSLRNTLLNLSLRRRAIQLMSFDVDKIEDNLQDGEEYCILSKPDIPFFVDSDERLHRSKLLTTLEPLVKNDLSKHIIHTYQVESETKTTLKSIYRSARTAIEETGANSLFLAIGTLRWYETENSSQPHYAPILLLPVEMVYKKGQYYIRTRDEEITLNVTLIEFLRQNYDIKVTGLDVLPKDSSGVDVTKIFAILRTCLESQKNWDVDEECILGLFSFSKFLMWNDIHNHREQLLESDVVKSLVENRLTWKPAEVTTALGEMDKTSKPSDMAIPVAVDSSQMAAIYEAGMGNSFILFGPPGTGKSQTITNLIANALFQGKRVLFVAEKMAALSVVQKRLEKIGLEPFCLELHSNKSTKKHILEQLDKALGVAHIKEPGEYQKTANELYLQRQKLINYMEALHSVGEDGFSLYDCVVRYESLDVEPFDIQNTKNISGLVADTYADYENLLGGQLEAVFRVAGQPSKHPLRELIIGKEMLANQSEVIDIFKKAITLVDNVKNSTGTEAVDVALELIGLFEKAESLSGADLSFLFDKRNSSELNAYAEKRNELADLKKSILSTCNEDILTQDSVRLAQEWYDIQNKWFLPRYFASNSFVKKLRFFSPSISKGGVQPLLDSLRDYHKKEKVCGELQPKASQAIASLMDADMVKEKLQTWAKNENKTRDWYHWCEYRGVLLERNLRTVVDILESQEVDTSKVASQFFKGFFRRKSMEKISANEHINTFEGILFDEQIRHYRNLTAQFQELCKKELYARLAANVPRVTDNIDNSSEIGILKRNINSGRGLSIRDLFDNIPELLPRLCPCMLMSPMSVAQYINLDQKKFDLVIFDEASQMPTSESVGAIARGKALIVVGDPKQMPPTSFFSSNNVDEDEACIDDMESILEDCRTLSIPSLQLSWHYRSRHESLIAFSNNEYYDGSLITFPSTDDKQTKVNYVPVKGVYDKGGKRQNKAEAEAIVKEIERRLLDENLRKFSIGVIAFSVVQQNLIEDMLNDRLESNRQLAEAADSMYEPIFVKNLENVQGDERDVILFSIGYGPDKNGNVSMNFGPLNNSGGERRLNVAVSRARHQMIVYSTLRSSHIDLRRSSARGVEGLKHFLEYAESQTLPQLSQNVQSVSDTVIAEQIGRALRLRGYDVQLGVGRSQFKVDVALVDKENPSSYALGILLDGEEYKNTQTTRDREIVQPSVLESLSWNIMRVWTVDWHNNPERVLSRIEQVYAEKPQAPVAPIMTPAFDISSEVEVEEESHALPYNVFSPDKTYSDVKSAVKAIVSVEQPIVTSLLNKRVAAALGKPRVTPTLQAEVAEAVKGFYAEVDRGGYAYYLSEADAKAFTGYRTASGRDITDIPFVEIENVLLDTVRSQVSLSEDSAVLISAKQLGFTHRGTNISQSFFAAVDNLIKRGLIVREEGRLKIVVE